MLDGYRQPLDPTLPIVATSVFSAGDRSFHPGDSVDWRSLGATEYDLVVWAKYGYVGNAPLITASIDELTEAELEKLTAPQSQSKRNQRKR